LEIDVPDSKPINRGMPSEKPNHPPKDPEKPDAGKKDRMGEDDKEGDGGQAV
jgi:hypothetical protein